MSNMALVNAQSEGFSEYGLESFTKGDFLKPLYSEVSLTRSCSYYNITNPTDNSIITTGATALKVDSIVNEKGELINSIGIPE